MVSIKLNRLNASTYVFSLFLGAAMVAPSAIAQEDFFGNIEVAVTENTNADQAWSVIGWVRQKMSYGLQAPGMGFSREDRDWTKIETSSFVRLEWQANENTAFRLSAKASADAIYQIKDNENYSADEVDEFETRFELKDAYVETTFGGDQQNAYYVKFGNQTIVWGEAENLRITDLINTEDRFTFGQQDLEDIRLPVPGLRINYNFKKVLIDGVITYKAGSDDIGPAYDEFDPYIAFRSMGYGAVQFDEGDPDKQFEVLMRLSGRYSKGDWAVVAAQVNQNSLDVSSISATIISPSTMGQVIVDLDQDRFNALGANINWTRGSWLAFTEVGMHFDKRLQANIGRLLQLPISEQNGSWREKDQSLVATGLEYSGFRNTTISVEADYIHTHKFDDSLGQDRRQLGYSARVLWNGFNERLQVVGVWNQLPDQGGQIGRISLDYDWSDSIELGLLWVSYSADQGRPLAIYRHNDSIQLQFEYSFQR